MRSFGIFATLALAVVSYAAPLAPAGVKVPSVQTPELPTSVEVPTVNAGDLVARCDTCKSLPDIITGITTDISPLIDQLKGLSAVDCTVEKITPIVDEIKVIVNGAIVDVKALVGVSIDVVLTTADGVLSLVNLCQLISTLFTLIFGCFGIVLKIVASVEYDGVCGLFAEVGVLLATLLQLIFGIVGGLLVIIRPLLTVCISVIIELGCSDAFKFVFGLGY
ncbi:hypothetical protein VKT23_007577 [Stygiomarasmius scandens]|uniref:Transmembrane protein n=1 Tax=Marasmiellus scandens TaxID=2682957 RepID=A0ABR1JL85_9AGAR